MNHMMSTVFPLDRMVQLYENVKSLVLYFTPKKMYKEETDEYDTDNGIDHFFTREATQAYLGLYLCIFLYQIAMQSYLSFICLHFIFHIPFSRYQSKRRNMQINI